MRLHYSDQQLAALLAHARDGKLAYQSCCCFISIPTADHALRSELNFGKVIGTGHYQIAMELSGANSAEAAFLYLGEHVVIHDDWKSDDKVRRRILIPMVLAEMRRRERSRAYVIGVDAAVGSSYTVKTLVQV